MFILSVIQIIINTCMKILHSHAIVSLVSWILSSILKYFYAKFVWGILIEFDDVVIDIYDFLIFNLIFLCSVGIHPRYPYLKLLQFHTTNSLLFYVFDSHTEWVVYKTCMRGFIWCLILLGNKFLLCIWLLYITSWSDTLTLPFICKNRASYAIYP